MCSFVKCKIQKGCFINTFKSTLVAWLKVGYLNCSNFKKNTTARKNNNMHLLCILLFCWCIVISLSITATPSSHPVFYDARADVIADEFSKRTSCTNNCSIYGDSKFQSSCKDGFCLCEGSNYQRETCLRKYSITANEKVEEVDFHQLDIVKGLMIYSLPMLYKC